MNIHIKWILLGVALTLLVGYLWSVVGGFFAVVDEQRGYGYRIEKLEERVTSWYSTDAYYVCGEEIKQSVGIREFEEGKCRAVRIKIY